MSRNPIPADNWLNYHHLLYFWTVAETGGVSAAAKALRLTQSTVSTQIRTLEHSLGIELFKRAGRKLELTAKGRMVYGYASEIFSLGRELMSVARGDATGRARRLHVGVSVALPRLILHRLLAPALKLDEPFHVVCHEDRTEQLIDDLAMHSLDVVLTDAPVAGDARVRAANHFLGECGVSFVAAPELAKRIRDDFPRSVDGAPMLLPTEGTVLRRTLEDWFDRQSIRPRVVGEFADSALLSEFGQAGEGMFAAATVVAPQVEQTYNVSVVGQTDDIRARFYAITAQRRITHPAVEAIAGAKQGLFTNMAAPGLAAAP